MVNIVFLVQESETEYTECLGNEALWPRTAPLYSDQIPKSEQFRPVRPPNPWLFVDAVWVVMETCKFFYVFFDVRMTDDW